MNNTFNPALAARELIENIREIDAMTDKVIEKRNALLLAEAAYMDTKTESRKKRLAEMSVTAANQWIEIDTNEAKKEYLKISCELRNLQDLRDVLIKSNENLKLRIRMATDEMKTLSLNI
jgi:hypothetical protein